MKEIRIVEVPEQAAFRTGPAARYLGICPNTLRKRSDLGLVQVRRDVNGDRIFLLRDLDSYLASLPLFHQGDDNVRRLAGTGRRKKGGAI